MNTNELLDLINYWIGQLAGGVWIVLTGFLIYVLYKLYKEEGRRDRTFLMGLILLISIWLYPVYAFTTNNLWIGEIGNIVTMIFTIFFYFRLKANKLKLQNWMIPQTIWITIATINLGLLIYQVQ